MAAAMDGNTSNFLNNTGTPLSDGTTPLSIMLWLYLRDTETRTMFCVHGPLNGFGNHVGFGSDANGDVLAMHINGTDSGTGSTLANNAWHHLALTKGDGTNIYRMYLNGVEDFNLTSSNFMSKGEISIGQTNNGAWPFDGRVTAYKSWDTVALSASDILQEMEFFIPLTNLDNLAQFCPMIQVSTVTGDYSGNGEAFAEQGTITYEDGPGIAWAPQEHIYGYKPTAAAPGGNLLLTYPPRMEYEL